MSLHRTRFRVSICAAAAPAILGAFALAGAAGAQTSPGTPQQFLTRRVGFTSDDIRALDDGAVVTKLLPTGSRTEVAVFAAVAVAAPRAAFVARIHDHKFLLLPARVGQFGLFSTPAVAADAAGFVISPGDVGPLGLCRPGQCDMKLSRDGMDAVRRVLAAGGPHPEARLSALARDRMADYINAYRAQGGAAMVVYADAQSPVRSSDAFLGILHEAQDVYGFDAELRRYLAEYPAASLPGSEDSFSWRVERYPHLHQVTTVVHGVLYEPPAGCCAVFAEKQLYANHYFEAALTVTSVVDRPSAASQGTAQGVYVFRVYRARLDALPSVWPFNIRGRVIGKLRDAVRSDLLQVKRELEQAP